jgi:cytochrome P450
MDQRVAGHLARIDAALAPDRWPLVRKFMYEESLPFFSQLRNERPVLELPDLTIVSRFADCALVLRRYTDFGVDLYKPKQGDYFMAQDDTADHWRDKSVMKSILDFEDVPAMRTFVGRKAAEILAAGKGEIDAPKTLTRAVPIALVQEFFGFKGGNPQSLTEWSYWNQQDAFHNQFFDRIVVPDPERIVSERKKANVMLALYLGRVVFWRSIAVRLGLGGKDSVARLLRLQQSGGLKFPVQKVIFQIGGLLIGAVETTSHAVNNALAELLRRPEALEGAKRAAVSDDPKEFDGYVFEALRFNPAFPYFFRVCHRPTVLAGGTPFAKEVKTDTVVMAVTHSAMFDEASFPDADRFDPARSHADCFTFGQGFHECLGRVIAQAMVPEIVRQVLRLSDLRALGPVEFRGGVPESFRLAWRT